MRLVASMALRSIVSSDASIRGLSPPSPDSFCVCRREPRPRGGNPIYTTACYAGPNLLGCLHQHPDRGMTPPRPRAYTSLSTARRNHPVSSKRQSAMSNLQATATIPIRRKRLPRSRSVHETTHSDAPAESGANSRPTPWSSSARAGCRLGDPLFPRTFAALIWCRRKALTPAHFPPILEGTPAEKFHHQQPCPIDANAFEQHQLAHLVDMRVGRGLQLGLTLCFHFCNLRTEKGVMHTRAAPRRRRPGGIGEPSHSRRPSSCSGNLVGLTKSPDYSGALDPGHGTGPLLQSFQIPVQMAMILGLDRGHLDYLPHVALAR